jgi:hypothetical protein
MTTTHARTHARAHTHTHTHTHTRTHARTQTQTPAGTSDCRSSKTAGSWRSSCLICVYTNLYICINISIYIYINIYICQYIYIYIHVYDRRPQLFPPVNVKLSRAGTRGCRRSTTAGSWRSSWVFWATLFGRIQSEGRSESERARARARARGTKGLRRD